LFPSILEIKVDLKIPRFIHPELFNGEKVYRKDLNDAAIKSNQTIITLKKRKKYQDK
jgi:hypothetical protein